MEIFRNGLSDDLQTLSCRDENKSFGRHYTTIVSLCLSSQVEPFLFRLSLVTLCRLAGKMNLLLRSKSTWRMAQNHHLRLSSLLLRSLAATKIWPDSSQIDSLQLLCRGRCLLDLNEREWNWVHSWQVEVLFMRATERLGWCWVGDWWVHFLRWVSWWQKS